MRTVLSKEVEYYFSFENGDYFVNNWLEKIVEIEFQNEINCIHCGRKTKKSFFQGYCYPCFIKLPQTDECILHPEKCMAHKGISRDMEWSEKNCLTDHVVYLSNTGTIKVGVTRETQVPTRWIDQGASQAIQVAQTPNRHIAGLIEVDLKQYFKDKTQWQKMLKTGNDTESDLAYFKSMAVDKLNPDLKEYLVASDEIVQVNYPIVKSPDKVKSFNLDKVSYYKGKLVGIKGQYLIFEDGMVFNVRKHGGYKVKLIL
ncbi:MAG: DUF2797 domain-containing protein [Marinilabiliales bacterium]|nr:MAG: DUF2797 domain-containing protein [Marinilabiliales bacterium]